MDDQGRNEQAEGWPGDDSTSVDRELDWPAFRYLAGEMEGEESVAFERRLEQEQAVREAVASMMEVVDCLSVVMREQAIADPAVAGCESAAARWWAGSVAALAASVAVVLAVWGLPRPRAQRAPGDARLPPLANVAAVKLAVIWGQQREPLDEPMSEVGARLAGDVAPAATEFEPSLSDSSPLTATDAWTAAWPNDESNWIEAAVVSMAAEHDAEADPLPAAGDEGV